MYPSENTPRQLWFRSALEQARNYFEAVRANQDSVRRGAYYVFNLAGEPVAHYGNPVPESGDALPDEVPPVM
jgi:hypothetical protein